MAIRSTATILVVMLLACRGAAPQAEASRQLETPSESYVGPAAPPAFDAHPTDRAAMVLRSAWSNRARPNAPFGWRAALLDDLDGDGVREIAVGVSRDQASVVDLLCGASGRWVRSIRADYGEGSVWLPTYFGAALDTVPDVDGDGRSELVIGDCIHDPITWASPFAAFLVSPRSGERHRWRNDRREGFGYDVRGIADVDGDLAGDVLVRTWGWNDHRVTCFSGRTGNELYEACVWSNDVFCVVEDADEDLVPDFVVDCVEPEGDPRVHLALFSGRTGTRRWHRPMGSDGVWFRGAGATAGDWNRDGGGDLGSPKVADPILGAIAGRWCWSPDATGASSSGIRSSGRGAWLPGSWRWATPTATKSRTWPCSARSRRSAR
jgi:hypothetical protein